MTKNALAASSLVAAIPAGVMAYLGVMAFLEYPEKMGLMLQIVTGTILLFSVLLVLMPFGVLLFAKKPASDEAAAGDGTGEPAETVAAPVAAGAAEGDPTEAGPVMLDEDDDFDQGFEPTGEFPAAEVDELEFDEPAIAEESFELEDDEFDFEDDDEIR